MRQSRPPHLSSSPSLADFYPILGRAYFYLGSISGVISVSASLAMGFTQAEDAAPRRRGRHPSGPVSFQGACSLLPRHAVTNRSRLCCSAKALHTTTVIPPNLKLSIVVVHSNPGPFPTRIIIAYVLLRIPSFPSDMYFMSKIFEWRLEAYVRPPALWEVGCAQAEGVSHRL
jgi:hypothetical protein